MKDLLRTTPGGNGVKPHDHIVFVAPEMQKGECSTDSNHSHILTWVPGEPAVEEGQVDEMGNPLPASPGTPGYFQLEPAEDGHTHEILPDPLPRNARQEKKLSDDEVVHEVHQYYQSTLEINSESLTDAEESEGYYDGKGQWTDAEKAYLKSEQRACIVINDTKKETDKLSGNQRQTRSDIKFLPMGGTDQKVCDLATITVKNILEQCYFEREESKAFVDAIVRGLGWWNIYVDKQRNPEGDIIVEHFCGRDAKAGEHQKEDLSDCEVLIKDKMYSLGKLKATYPEDFEEIQNAFEHFQNRIPEVVNEDKSKDAYEQGTDVTTQGMSFNMFVGGVPMVDVQRKEMRVVELWKKKYITVPVLANPDADFYYDGYGLTKKDLKAIKTIPDFFRVDRVVPKMVIYRVCGGKVLERSDPAKLPIDDFFMVPIYCTKRGNRWWGKVHDVKGSQSEINKRHSQLIDIGNKAAGSIWMYSSQTFATPKDEKNFDNNAAKPGAKVKVTDLNERPVRDVGGEIPPVAVELLNMGHATLKDYFGVSVESAGANESNAKFTLKQKLAFVGNEELSDNLKFAKVRLGRLLIAVIQDLYTPQRIWDLVMDEDAKAKAEGRPSPTLGGQSLENFTVEDIERLLNENDLTKTQVIVAEGEYSPSIRRAIFAVLTDLKTAGADVPLELLFEFADLPKEVKDKVVLQIQQQSEAEAAVQKEKSDTELLKTAMGKGIMVPEIQAKLAEILGVEAPPMTEEDFNAQNQSDIVEQ